MIHAAVAVVGVQVAAVVAAWLLGSRERFLRQYLGLFVSAAVGVLLATGLLHLLPEAVTQLGNRQALWMLVGGTMLVLFCGERIFQAATGATAEPEVQLRNCHEIDIGHHHHGHGARPNSIVVASMLHSLVDGAAVSAAFAISDRVGWLTASAIALHEIPHRLGDYALFIHLKVSAPKALLLAIGAGVPSLAGVLVVAWVGLSHAQEMAWLLPVSAGSFLYIACVNLIPEIREEMKASALAAQIVCLCAGVLLVVGAGFLLPF